MSGSKYEETKKLSTVDVAKRIRADIKAAGLPAGVKISVRVRRCTYTSAIDVEVTAVPEGFSILNVARVREERANPHSLINERDLPRYAPEMIALLATLKGIWAAYNYNRSDLQSDVFDVRYYGDVRVDWEIERDDRAGITLGLEAAEIPVEVPVGPVESCGCCGSERLLASNEPLNCDSCGACLCETCGVDVPDDARALLCVACATNRPDPAPEPDEAPTPMATVHQLRPRTPELVSSFVREAVLTYAQSEGLPFKPSKVISSADVARLFEQAIPDAPAERMAVLVLDARQVPVAWATVSMGDLGTCTVSPASILRFVLIACGERFIIAHNHPSGDTLPSAEDRAVTHRLTTAANAIGLRLLDHVIVAHGRPHFSFCDSGLLGGDHDR
jgi:DNA repair protein RadC